MLNDSPDNAAVLSEELIGVEAIHVLVQDSTIGHTWSEAHRTTISGYQWVISTAATTALCKQSSGARLYKDTRRYLCRSSPQGPRNSLCVFWLAVLSISLVLRLGKAGRQHIAR